MRRIGETLTKDLRKTESADDTLEDFEPECSNDDSEQCGAGFKASPPRPNPFSRFAYQRSPNSKGLSAQKPRTPKSLLGKRKDELRNTDSDTVPDGTEIVKRGEIASSSGSKRVKIYEHLREINDNLDVGLDIVFCGINPGEQSAKIGHHYGNPMNHFWSCLHESDLTPRRLDPREDSILPKLFSIGLTNLVDRPTFKQSELSKKEQVEGVSKLLEKVARYRPRVVCFVGLGIADIVKSTAVIVKGKGKAPKSKATVGLQGYKMVHAGSTDISETVFYAVSSTSGRVVKYQKTDKIQQFKDLRNLKEQLKNHSFDTTDLIPLSSPLHTTMAEGDL